LSPSWIPPSLARSGAGPPEVVWIGFPFEIHTPERCGDEMPRRIAVKRDFATQRPSFFTPTLSRLYAQEAAFGVN
jgi:hypothetical protein